MSRVVLVLCLIACGRVGFDERVHVDAGPTCAADLTSDPENCGACTHSCLGGDCVEGLCQPITLATEQGEIRQIILDEDFLYFTTPGNVKRMAKGTRMIETIATYSGRGFRMTELGDYIYWVTRDTGLVARALKKPGQPTETIATNQGDVGGIATDGATVWWNNYPTAGRIFARPIGSAATPAELIGPTDELTAMRLVGDTLYFLRNEAGLFAIPAAGGTVTTIAPSVGTWEMAIAGDDVFLASADRLAILRVSITLGTVAQVTEADGPWGIAVDDKHVYFANELGGSIARAPLGGGPAEVLEQVELPVGIAVDGRAVYWTTIGGTVGMRAK